jgi:hypothetical protein
MSYVMAGIAPTGKADIVRDGLRAPLILALAQALLTAGAPASGHAQEPPGGPVPLVHPSGTVLDRQTQAPVVVARVLLLDRASLAHVSAAETDSTGTFVLPPVARGSYVLRVERIGYKTAQDSITMHTPEDADLVVFMVAEAIDLEPVVVTASRTTAYYLRDFERRRATGSGTFLMRPEIERSNSNSTSELLQRLGRVRVMRGRQGEASLFIRGTCRPQIFVDGALLQENASIDTATDPDHIAAIEVYSDAGVPIQYAIGSPCGVILVWTHPAVKVEGQKNARWKWVFAGSLAAVLLLIRL